MRSKKAIAVLFLVLMLVSIPPWATAAGETPITIMVDGKLVATEVPPIIRDGYTMVPLRAIGESLGLQVEWFPDVQMVGLSGSGYQISLTIGSKSALVNNAALPVAIAPFIINGRTMVPIRFVSEAIGCAVNWDANQRLVTIQSPSPLKVLAYYALGSSENSSWDDLFGAPYPDAQRGNTDVVDAVALGWYTLDETGMLSTRSQSGWSRPQGWEDVLQAAEQSALDTQMTVHMTDQNSTIMKLLADEEAQAAAIAAITETADLYDGVNLDFEGLGWNDTGDDLLRVRNLFSQFTAKLAASLHQSGKTLALSLHPQNSAYPGYDYQALGTLADQIIVMAYDYGPRPEPMDRVAQAITMARAVVPAEKLYLGISIPSENAESMGEKIALASDNRLGGIALWRLGLVTDVMWEQLRSNPQIEKK